MDYKVNIRVEKFDKDDVREEIWADIINISDGKVIKKLICWKDNQGIFHDENSFMPPTQHSLS